MKKIYLAAPYTHRNIDVVNERVTAINRKAAELMIKGDIVFSPISHSHYISRQECLPGTFEFWQAQNHSMIEWCDEVHIYCLPGWMQSKGVRDEYEHALALNKKIEFIEEEN